MRRFSNLETLAVASTIAVGSLALASCGSESAHKASAVVGDRVADKVVGEDQPVVPLGIASIAPPVYGDAAGGKKWRLNFLADGSAFLGIHDAPTEPNREVGVIKYSAILDCHDNDLVATNLKVYVAEGKKWRGKDAEPTIGPKSPLCATGELPFKKGLELYQSFANNAAVEKALEFAGKL